MPKNHKVFSQLLTVLKRVVQLSISSHFYLIAFSTLQVWWLCVHARQCMNTRQLRMIFEMLFLCSGKDVWRHCSSHKTGWWPIQPIQHIERLLRLLITFVFFAFWRVTLLCLVYRIKQNINVDFCVRINECLLTENMYIFWFMSAYLFYSSAPKLGTFLWATRYKNFISLKIVANIKERQKEKLNYGKHSNTHYITLDYLQAT